MTQQLSFDPLDYEGFDDVPAATLAKKDRDEAYRNLKHCGNKCRRWVLRDQLRPYASFGVPDGRVRDIYYLTIY